MDADLIKSISSKTGLNFYSKTISIPTCVVLYRVCTFVVTIAEHKLNKWTSFFSVENVCWHYLHRMETLADTGQGLLVILRVGYLQS